MAAPAASAPSRWCYRLGRSLYVHVTSAANSVSLVQSRGPGFAVPFLPHGLNSPDTQQPSVEDLAQDVREELAVEPAEAVVFAGTGEPTLALKEVLDLGERLRGTAQTLRLNTNGLGSLQHGRDIVPELCRAGITSVSVALNAATATRYRQVMRPRIQGSNAKEAFDAACAFVSASAAALSPASVEVTCVAAPGVDTSAVAALVQTLAPSEAEVSFRERPYFPLQPAKTFPVHCAAHAGDLDVLASAADSELLSADDRGNPPIVWAAEAGQADVIRALAARGCDVGAVGMSGNTALHRACNRAHDGAVRALLELRADPDAYNAKGQTPLHHAAFYQHVACVRALLAGGADPKKTDGRGRTPAEDTADDDIRAELERA